MCVSVRTPQNTVAHQLIYQKVTRTELKKKPKQIL